MHIDWWIFKRKLLKLFQENLGPKFEEDFQILGGSRILDQQNFHKKILVRSGLLENYCCAKRLLFYFYPSFHSAFSSRFETVISNGFSLVWHNILYFNEKNLHNLLELVDSFYRLNCQRNHIFSFTKLIIFKNDAPSKIAVHSIQIRMHQMIQMHRSIRQEIALQFCSNLYKSFRPKA